MTVNFEKYPIELRKLLMKTEDINRALQKVIDIIHSHIHLSTLPHGARGESPQIYMVQQILWVDNFMIPLVALNKTRCLIEAFFTNEQRCLDKKSIIEKVYGPDQRSFRYSEALDGNLTKLMSRTRTFLQSAMETSVPYKNIDWFVYDAKKKVYWLYMVGNHS